MTAINFYPHEKHTSFVNYWDKRKFPRFADVETTNFCNARCVCCLQYKLKRERGIMSDEDFRRVADTLKLHDVKIRGMYTTGEPFLDPTLFEKYKYARKIGVMASYVSLNTNVSLLTKEKFDAILENTDNITLSFFNVGEEFERLTGGLSWKKCYKNAVDFINYREYKRPSYRIFIGCNPVKGSSLENVKEAFKDYRVEYAVDAELRWAGKFVTGVIDRAIMHPQFRCDGHEGVLMIKWNGDIEACSYDFSGETHYANIFKDGWDEIVHRFRENWKKPFPLCKRCDYWHLYWRTKANGFKMVEDWADWQKPYLAEGEQPQR